MPRDTSGNYTLPAGTLVNVGDVVLPGQHNPAMNDIASALTTSLSRNGNGPMLADLNMGGFSVTNVSTPSGILNIGLFTDIGTLTIPPGTLGLRTNGYSVPNVGGAYYAVTSNTGETLFRKFSTSANSWFEIAESRITPAQAGGTPIRKALGQISGSVTDNTTAINAVSAYCTANLIEMHFDAFYAASATIVMNSKRDQPTGASGMRVTGIGYNWCGVYFTANLAVGIAINTNTVPNYVGLEGAEFTGFAAYVAPGITVNDVIRIQNAYNCIFGPRAYWDGTTSGANSVRGVVGGAAVQWCKFRNAISGPYGLTLGQHFGTGIYIGNDPAEVVVTTAAVSKNIFENCTMDFCSVSAMTHNANDTLWLSSDSVTPNYAYIDEASDGTIYQGCWDEGAGITGYTIRAVMITTTSGTSLRQSSNTRIYGGYDSSIYLDACLNVRAAGSFNSIQATANTINAVVEQAKQVGDATTSIVGSQYDITIIYRDTATGYDTELMGSTPKTWKFTNGNEIRRSNTGNLDIRGGVLQMGGTQVLTVQQPAIPNTSGATLAALEAEVNKLKAMSRVMGLIAP